MGSLTDKTISATKWYASLSIVQQIVHYSITIILARILSPADFGILAIVNTFIGVVRMFQDIGLGPALVQKKNISTKFIDSIFWFSQIVWKNMDY